LSREVRLPGPGFSLLGRGKLGLPNWEDFGYNDCYCKMAVVGSSVTEVLSKAKELILAKGKRKKSQRGETVSLPCVDLVLKDPESDAEPYPVWDQEATDWYLNYFVDKNNRLLPENISEAGQDLTPYTYAHRSRFFDFGLGYTLAFCRAVKALGLDLQRRKHPDEFSQFLLKVGQKLHLQNVLAVMSWWGRKRLSHWLDTPEDLEDFLDRTRQDTLLEVINQVCHSPKTRRAITPSFIYPNIDLALPAGGVPPYQNYQLLNTPEGLISIHLHRSMDLGGGIQLDFAHDVSWAKIVAENLGVFPKRIIIRVNDLHLYQTGKAAQPGNIKEWLTALTDRYPASPEGVEQEWRRPEYEESIKMVWQVWR
jgi:hypothetical protein